MRKIILLTLLKILIMTNVSAQKKYAYDSKNRTFAGSQLVKVERVVFKNQYKMDVVGNLFISKDIDINKQYPAIVVGHPMGAVKEQSANLYATHMAERGFITLSIDLSFWGESAGDPRNTVSPDIYAEDFSAAVDYLSTLPIVSSNQIGGIGVCGSGGFLISAAKIDSRIKALATISMYDMGQATRNGLHKSQTIEQRKQIIANTSEQRNIEFESGIIQYTGGTPLAINENSNPIEIEFYNFYRTSRGEFIPKGATPQTATRPTLTSNVKFMNFYPFNDIETISPRPLLFITGDKAHSKEFSEDAYTKAAEPKELYYVKDAGHVDLYDQIDIIPFDKLESFFKHYLTIF